MKIIIITRTNSLRITTTYNSNRYACFWQQLHKYVQTVWSFMAHVLFSFSLFFFPSPLHANIQLRAPSPSLCELHNTVPLCRLCLTKRQPRRTREGWQTFSTTIGVHATAVATGVQYNVGAHSTYVTILTSIRTTITWKLKRTFFFFLINDHS